MNIDLLIGKQGQSGLLCSGPFALQPLGVIFDALARELIVEFTDGGDPLHLNISVEERFSEKLLLDHSVFIAAAQAGEITESLEVPLVYLNDPYGGKFNDRLMIKTHRAVIGFEEFLKRSSFAQPIHRDDLGDENTLSGILGGDDVRTLKFSPSLTRQRELEKSPQYVAAPVAGMTLGGGATRARTKDGGEATDY